MHFCYPRLSEYDLLLFRLFGPGLGNLLFPWARAVVYASKSGARLIAPTWPQVKAGTLLRREADSRFYSDLFQTPSWAIAGFERLRLLTLNGRISESNALQARRNSVVEFTGMAGFFDQIQEDHELVRDRLIEITRAQHRQGLQFSFEPNSISLHVRLGDFAVAKSVEQLNAGKANTRVPLEWFVDALRGYRDVHGSDAPAYVFSDGSDEELAPLLSEPKCRRLGFGSSVADLLALGNSRHLIASGSTFSMWASYLGRMPVVWYPGQLKCRLYASGKAEIEAADRASVAAAFASLITA